MVIYYAWLDKIVYLEHGKPPEKQCYHKTIMGLALASYLQGASGEDLLKYREVIGLICLW